MGALHRVDRADPGVRLDLRTLLRRILPDASSATGADPAARSAGRSHGVGAVSADRMVDRPDRGFWALADGVGDDPAGGVAAAALVDALAALADAASPGIDAIRTVLVRVNAAVRAARLAPGRVTGASVVALHHAEGVATILWAGDARAYRCRAGRFALLTRDHDVARELVDTGTVPAERAAALPNAQVVTRAIGLAPGIEIETVAVAVAPGDMLLLCSRALASNVPASMIARRLRPPAEETVDALIEAASSANGSDGVSVLAIEVC